MKHSRVSLFFFIIFIFLFARLSAHPTLPGIDEAMLDFVESGEITGAVTLVSSGDSTLHFGAVGQRDRDAALVMETDTIFRIASMTKPVCGVAVLILVDEGLLNLDDPVADYIPEFADLKTPSGTEANLTLRQLLNHTAGLSEVTVEEMAQANSLADLIPVYLSKSMKGEPGERWRYSQSGINTAARIVELVSGLPFNVFLQRRIFDPLGMKDTTHYLDADQRKRLVVAYAKDRDTGEVNADTSFWATASPDRPPLGNRGLYSTAADYTAFCQMLLNGGQLNGTRILSKESVAELSRNSTGDLKTGFVPGSAWGVATGIVRESQGVTAMLSSGTYGHGGAFGTQAWIDPEREIIYVLMIQRRGFGNGDASNVRKMFMETAAAALGFDAEISDSD
ncbi:beta-lactamase family protein [Puniceicoccaceae bacterium K14]|nr:beta-lactamase family protein [Puniceicoccaceae bacterium K14]